MSQGRVMTAYKGQDHYRVTAINFILPLNLKFKCEFKFTKYLRGTKYLFAIYQTNLSNPNTDKPKDF